MITKNDCMSVLVRLEDNGVPDAAKYMRKLLILKEPNIEILKFIARESGFEIGHFYEVLRKSHNKRKSPLYTNILKDTLDTKELVVMLSSLLTQILLYASKLPNPSSFYKEARAEEISRVLNNYFITGEIDACLTMRELIRADLMVMEYIAGRRELLD